MSFTSLSGTFVSCGKDSDEEPTDPTLSSVLNLTQEQIKATFPGLRVDSIHTQYHNIKITYNNGLLVSYKQLDSDGKVQRVNFNFVYTPDTVFVNTFKAVIGNNGLVKQLICPSGKVCEYSYNERNHLIRYDVNTINKNDKRYYEINWEDDNISSRRKNYQADIPYGSWYYEDVFYTYTYDVNNNGGILPFQRSNASWIDDTDDINEALYYAGLLGRGTKKIPTKSYIRDSNSTFNLSVDWNCNSNEAGYVLSVGIVNLDEYFYK